MASVDRGARGNKPAASAITSSRDDELTERRHGYQNYFFLLTMDSAQKPYYCGSNNPHTSAPSSRLLCLALHRCARPLHPPSTPGKASALGCKQGALSASS